MTPRDSEQDGDRRDDARSARPDDRAGEPARDPRYVIRHPAPAGEPEASAPAPPVVPVGRTERPEPRPASAYVIRAGSAETAPGAPLPSGATPSREQAPALRPGPDDQPAAPSAATPAEPEPAPRRSRRSRVLRRTVAVTTVLALLGGGAAAVVLSGVLRNPNPFAGRTLYVDPDSEASRAVDAATDAQTRATFLTLAEQPTAIWLTPEEHPAGDVGPFVAATVADAEAQDALPVFVVYGIPDRDCGSYSAGGTAAGDYEAWVSEIATALGGERIPVILEPDAISLADECADVPARMELLRTAGATLTAAGAPTYLDGGHSNWHSVQEMADLLRQAGVEQVRGFATNVSNYNDDASELAYATRLSALLDDAPFLVDTGRNGAGSSGEWCNPDGAAIGAVPGSLSADGLEVNLWVKPPGESDGTCNGGPEAGVWWPDQATRLVAAAAR